jgi:hypothetical protein
MEFKITERHIESLYAAKRLFERQLRNNRKGYEEFRNKTDREGIVILESYSYLIERDQEHLNALNDVLRGHERELYARKFSD